MILAVAIFLSWIMYLHINASDTDMVSISFNTFGCYPGCGLVYVICQGHGMMTNLGALTWNSLTRKAAIRRAFWLFCRPLLLASLPLPLPRFVTGGAHLVDGLVTGVLQRQVHHGVLQCAAHVELQGEVVHTLHRHKNKHKHIAWTLGQLLPYCVLPVILST